MEVLYGLHPVEEALKAGRRRFDHVLIARERRDDRLAGLIAQCRQAGIRIRQESREQLTLAAKTAAHQGIVALVRPQEFLSIEDLYDSGSATPAAARLVLALDGVEDPQNLGALLRVADGAGVDGVVLTERRSAPLSPAAVKASAATSGSSVWMRKLPSAALPTTTSSISPAISSSSSAVRAQACIISSAKPATICFVFPWPAVSAR